jgi:putative ABC transport system permease protein
MNECRLAVRRLTKRPAATVLSVLTLASAMGAAVATWSLLSAVLLRPLPVRDADRVAVAGQLTTAGPRSGITYDGLNYPYLRAFRDSGIFEHVAAEWTSPMVLLTRTSGDAVPARDTIGFATWDLFDLLGVRVTAGRGFSDSDDRRGAVPAAILTDDYWRRKFDRRPDAIGRTIIIAGKPVTIVGVAQRGFHGLELARPVDVYLPFHTIGDVGSPLTNYFGEAGHASSPTAGTRIVARLRGAATFEQVASQLNGLKDPSAGAAGSKWTVVLTRLNQAAIPTEVRGTMKQFAGLLAGTVGLLVLIGCGTAGMFLLIRTEARREELAMCVALGASRIRLASGIVLEGTLVAATGAVVAIPIAWWLCRGGAAFQLPGGVPVEKLELGINSGALLAAAVGAVLAATLISLIGATLGLTGSTVDGLRSRGGTTPLIARRRTRAALVAAEVAVALVLVTGAGLFARSLAAALRLNSGLDMGRVVTGSINLGPYGYDVARATAFFNELRSRLSANPAVSSVSYGVERGGMLGKITVDGLPRQFPSQVGFLAVDQDYFRTLGVRVSDGRDFSAMDGATAPRVTIVSASLGRALAGGANPLGRRVTMPFRMAGKPADVMEVVGIVDDVVLRVSELQPLMMYFPLEQTEPGISRTLTVRAAGAPGTAQREIMSAMAGIDRAVLPSQLQTLEERIDRQMAAQHFSAIVLGTLGAIALLLTTLGAYVLSESMAALRMREMGIRAALGATGRQLGAIVLMETLRLVGLGLTVGLVGAWLGAGAIRAFLFQVQPSDPVTLATAAALILVSALLVTLRPALRAARVDLATVLKET